MKRFFYMAVLPILWASVSFVSYYHPGDEYAMYAVSSIIGIWPFYLIQPDIHSLVTPIIVACVGGFIMMIVGFGMDRLRVNRWIWCGVWLFFSILLCFNAIHGYPTIKKALAKNGSWTAYIAGSMNMGLYLSVIVSVFITFLVLLIRRMRRRRAVNSEGSVS